ncbi:DUF4434 domain-containing protein [Candidatus Poribacteria bacterium]
MNSIQLDGVFVQPLLAMRWESYEPHLRRMAALGLKQIVFQWTTAHGYSLYPSRVYQQEWGMSGGDGWLAEILDIASDLDLQMWLGLDACRTITEDHYVSIDGFAQRCCDVATELAERYGKQEAFAGVYVPSELEEPPMARTAALLEKIVSHCHSLEREVLYSTRKPRLIPEGRHYEFIEQDQEWVAREKALHKRWANTWKKLVQNTKLDILMLRDDVGAERQPPEAIADDLHILRSCPRLWVQTPLYRAARDIEDQAPPDLHPVTLERLQKQLEASAAAEARIGFSYHDMESERGDKQHRLYQHYQRYVEGKPPAGVLNAPRKPARLVEDGLLGKARQIESLIHTSCMLHDQVITVVDTRYPLEADQNQWQEDADWLTGLYVGAENLRYAVTGEEEARHYAKASWNALHKLSNVSGVPGVVARHYRREFEGDLGTGRKRWHRNEDGTYWIGDISRDQLSGHIFGLAAYYDLVASEAERHTIEADVKAITDLIIDNNMVAVDWDGEPCIHGNFWVSPLFALSFLKSAYHITRKERYQQKYLELIDPHYFLGHALKDARVSGDPFFQHYHQDSPLYHLVQYETNPEILHHIMRCIELLYEDTRRHGNVFLLFDHQICHPESEAGRKGVAELLEFDVSHLNVAKWDSDAREYLKSPSLLPEIRRSLRYILEPDARLRAGKGHYIPLKYRPPKEFGWNYYTGEEAHRSAGRAGHHGINIQYSGVDYLLVYWMGRYHEIIA